MTIAASIRFAEINRKETKGLPDAITDLYDSRLDLLVIRNAFPLDLMQSLGQQLDQPDAETTWFHPNALVPTEDILILGTDMPAKPTCIAPRGPAFESYFESANRWRDSARNVLGPQFDVESQVSRLLEEVSGRRRVEPATSSDGRSYVPYTLRLVREGKQIAIHHDYHYPLGLYSELSQRLDTTTLVSFSLTLQSAEKGGALIVYSLNFDDPNPPQLPNGWTDLRAIEKQYERMRIELRPGDFVLLASGRRFHRVEPVLGGHSRVTLGGFLAFDKNRESVMFWS